MNTVRGAARPTRTLALSCLLASLLASCGVTEKINESTRVEYKGTGKLAPLEVPPDLINPRGDDRFVVPERQSADRSTYSGYQAARGAERAVATESRVLPSVEGIRLERAGTQRWLVVNQPADRLWPVLRDFWLESGFVLAIDSPATGIMETEFLENRAKIPQDFLRRAIGSLLSSLTSTGERDSFRTRVEAAAGGGTEIYISHRGLSEEVRSQVNGGVYWKTRPADPELEAEFLQRLVVKLGAPAERAQELAKAAAPAASTRAAAVESAAVDLGAGLALPDSFDRAWRRVGLALDRVGFTVEDRDRSKGLFFVRYIDPDVASEKPSFFTRLFSRSDAKSANTDQYRVQLDSEGTGSRLKVSARDGSALSSAVDRQVGSKILVLLREQLLNSNP